MTMVNPGHSLRVEVLGPVRAWRGDHELQLGGSRQRTVFAVLATRANKVVSHAELVDALWGDAPTASAASSVYTYVTGLRRVLEPGLPRRSPGQVLTSAGSGYLLRLEHGALDVDVFDDYRNQGRQRHNIGDLTGAARFYSAALDLWHGPALGGVSRPFAESERIRLGESRLALYAERADVLLALGKHAELATELPGMIQEHPHREGLWRILMLALYRGGRQAEALAAFQDLRRILIDDLGLEPHRDLQRLHQAILSGDPGLEPDPPPDAGAPSGASATTGQLNRVAKDLAAAVTRQWTAEIESRSLRLPRPIDVQWSQTKRAVATSASAVLDRTPGTGTQGRNGLRGGLSDLVATFRRLPTRQLVVLGEPGAGKTVLAIMLSLGLLHDPQPGEPIPVLLSPSSWDARREHLDNWLVRKLVEEYPGLANAAVYGPHVAERLVAEGWVMPVLDGLDEAPPRLVTTAMDALDHVMAGGRPMVVACRGAEYEQAVLRDGAVLSTAAVVEIEPVGLDEAIAFLMARQPPSDTRWQPLAEYLRLDPRAPLAHALSTPLMVDLARTAYGNPATDPGELRDAARFPDRASIEEHLLDAFLPTVYTRRQMPPSLTGRIRPVALRQYPPERAQRWLSFLARHLQRAQTRDFAWWELVGAIPAPILGLIGGLPAALLFAIIGSLAAGFTTGAAYGLAFALAGYIVNVLGRRPGPLRVQARICGSGARIFRRVGIGLALGTALGFAWSLSPGLILMLSLVFGFGLGLQVWFGVPVEIDQVPSPSKVLEQERVAALSLSLSFAISVGTFYGAADLFTKQIRFIPVFGGAFDLALSLAAGLAGVLLGRFAFGNIGAVAYGFASAAIGGLVFAHARTVPLGITAGVLFGLAVGLTICLSRAWGSFLLSLAWLGIRGDTPLRLMRFLEDAHRRGVLKQAGGTYQFRHARLQEHLVNARPYGDNLDRIWRPPLD